MSETSITGKSLKWIYKVFRTLAVTGAALVVGVPLLLYFILSLPPIQNYAGKVAEVELSKLLGVNVTIGHLYIEPFNRITLTEITVADSAELTHGPIATISRIGGAVNYYESLSHGKMVIDYVELMGLNGHIWRQSHNSPLNIQKIIDALKPKEENKPPTEFDIELNSVLIRQCTVAYDVIDAPAPENGRFDKNHILIKDLRADIHVPELQRNNYSVDIRRLKFSERSGLDVAMSGSLHADSACIRTQNLKLEAGASRLVLSDVNIPIKSFQTIGHDLQRTPIEVAILNGSKVALTDLGAFIPTLRSSTFMADMEGVISGTVNAPSVTSFLIDAPGLKAELSAKAFGLLDGAKNIAMQCNEIRVLGEGGSIANYVGEVSHLSPRVKTYLQDLGHFEINVDGNYSNHDFQANSTIETETLQIKATAAGTGSIPNGSFRGKATSSVEGRLPISEISSLGIGDISASFEADVTMNSGKFGESKIEATIESAMWGLNIWHNISAFVHFDGAHLSASLNSDNSGADLSLNGSATVDTNFKNLREIEGNLKIGHLDLSLFPVSEKLKEFSGGLQGNFTISSTDIYSTDINISLNNVEVENREAKASLGNIDFSLNTLEEPQRIVLKSDIVDLSCIGTFDWRNLKADLKSVMENISPALFSDSHSSIPLRVAAQSMSCNSFAVDIAIKTTAPLEPILALPVSIIYPVTVNGSIDAAMHKAELSVDAPYILQKDKLIENTALGISVDGDENHTGIYFTTVMPAKKGPVSLTVRGNGRKDFMDINASWEIAMSNPMRGQLNLDCTSSRSASGQLCGEINVKNSSMSFNDSLWVIHPATITIADGATHISNWLIENGSQQLEIQGNVGKEADDVATLVLQNVDLDYLFDALSIPNVDFGGIATGTITGRAIMSKNPIARTDDLSVTSISYNDCTFGDAKITASWDATEQAINLDADIVGENDSHSTVKGLIYPTKNGGGLNLAFGAHNTPVGFLQPFMSAFSSAVAGRVSGNARLFGTFSDLDLEGQAFAQDFRITLPFTGTTYSVTDSVSFSPGVIELHDLTLFDSEGHRGNLNGRLTHRAFHDPVFRFALTDAKDFLAYDIPENPDQIWYGKIYVNGGAEIIGAPGSVDINVTVSTAPASSFGFILSDNQSAGEYTFITFRDRNSGIGMSAQESLVPEAVRIAARKAREHLRELPTAINMNISVAANPNITVTLVMDPVAGDRIKAWGKGDLRMAYGSRNDEMEIFGTYTLERGNYNFSLQDIIVKDFSIDPGSSISFHGNPLAAQLNITAAYQTTANLTDLDESFRDDKDLARTTVPVRALLKVSGDMRAPELDFDLDFPSLSSDIDRKVRSLVNTEEMLTRQVIYLLALNRFYASEASTGAVRGNDFANLATNTLSSRISNLLGTISDNWTIAPSVRSDMGDFSDVEVDLALSSQLLNNRLLINGNLGYRDKSLNTTNFIGDFDIEYLLNHSGTLRLKAYNRFNDQTFYVKNALTTQGVGVVFKLDFDRLDSWLKSLRSKNMADSVSTKLNHVNDSVK